MTIFNFRKVLLGRSSDVIGKLSEKSHKSLLTQSIYTNIKDFQHLEDIEHPGYTFLQSYSKGTNFEAAARSLLLNSS